MGDIDILPFAPNYRAHYIPEGGHPKHYEIRYKKDYVMSWWRPSTPARKAPGNGSRRTHLHGQNVERLSPDAGRIVTRLSPLKLSRFDGMTSVFFRRDDGWCLGVVQDYANPSEIKRTTERIRRNAQNRIRRHLRQPTVWDRLQGDED